MPTVAAAFPFVDVRIDTSGLIPTSQRAPGVLAVVGDTGGKGNAPANRPIPIDTLAQAADQFAAVSSGVVQSTPLYQSIALALQQNPRPSTVYGVRTDAGGVAAGLAALGAADDVTFVTLANVTDVGADDNSGLRALRAHAEAMSAGGQKRLAVAMVNPTTARSSTYVTDIATANAPLRSSSSRMVLIAARGATVDVATAAAAAIAGYDPQVSMVLKPVRGITIPLEQQYNPTEIKGLSEQGIIPIIDPALVAGPGLYFAEGRTFTSDATQIYVDTVRVLDDIDFRLKAGLIGAVGDARITKSGLTRVKSRVEGILAPLVAGGTLDDFAIDIPVLRVLNTPDSGWSPADSTLVTTARANRAVDIAITVTYGPAVHRLVVTLTPKF